MEQIKGVPSYPKTGKRGVPQQFPRRLFNMLESESQLQQTAENLISWSESGKAFRIEDVTLFSKTVLPKYFRTSKFSSFQRNLNLVSEILAETKSWITLHAYSNGPRTRQICLIRSSHTMKILETYFYSLL